MKRKWMRNVFYGLIVFILMSIQSSNSLAIFEINPDFLMIIVILHSLHYGEYKGSIFAFAIGILEDAFSGTLFGLNAFILTLISFLTSIYKKYIFVSDIVAFLIYVIIATVIKYVFYILFYWIFRKTGLIDWYLLLKMAGEIAYNTLIGTVFFYLSPFIYKRSENPF